MSAVDKLVAAGRDPLEALLVPPAPDVAQWILEDDIERIDLAIANELQRWQPVMRQRLNELIAQRADASRSAALDDAAAVCREKSKWFSEHKLFSQRAAEANACADAIQQLARNAALKPTGGAAE